MEAAFRWCAVVAALAFGAACGPSVAHCLPANCDGCCAGDQCLPGTQDQACGAAGLSCTACVPGQTCAMQACVFDGGCSAASCSGCCASGACQSGTSLSACGANGAPCESCRPGQTCNTLGQCQGQPMCTGCYDATNTCQTGNTDQNCGTAGASCVSCSAGQVCQSGGCVTQDAGSCAPGSCNGCCSLGQCVPFSGQSAGECGQGGNACLACSNGLTCDGGACVGSCGACTGCCNGTTCVPASGESDSECGVGSACTNCTASSEYCGMGEHACTAAGAGALGAACASDGSCALGAHTHEPWCMTWPGGYCEDTCDSLGNNPGPCPNGGYCLGMLGSLGGGDYLGLCLIHCTGSCSNASDFCDPSVGNNLGYCVPKCTSNTDCNNFFGDPHATCNTANGQCCGIVNFACCSGNTCNDGSTCNTSNLLCGG